MADGAEHKNASAEEAGLGNEIDAAIRRAVEAGMSPDMACSVAINVVADNWILWYRDPVTDLAKILEGKEQQRLGGHA